MAMELEASSSTGSGVLKYTEEDVIAMKAQWMREMREEKRAKAQTVPLELNRYVVEKRINPSDPIIINVAHFRHTVLVSKCVGTVIKVVGKCNSITIEGCTQTNVVFEDVISSVYIINGEKVNVEANGTLSTINVEKSAGVNVYLTSEASRNAEIISCLSTEVNIVVPGATQNDDPKDLAIPYQFVTKLVEGKLETKSVEHSAN